MRGVELGADWPPPPGRATFRIRERARRSSFSAADPIDHTHSPSSTLCHLTARDIDWIPPHHTPHNIHSCDLRSPFRFSPAGVISHRGTVGSDQAFNSINPSSLTSASASSSTTTTSHPAALASTLRPMIKKTASQPDLRQTITLHTQQPRKVPVEPRSGPSYQSPPSAEPTRINTRDQLTVETLASSDPHLTRIPRKCSPKQAYRHKRTVSIASSIGSAIAQHHQLLLLHRQNGDESEAIDDDGDDEIEGGISTLLKLSRPSQNKDQTARGEYQEGDHEEETGEEEMIVESSGLDERRFSESCGSSTLGEAMSIDPEQHPSRPHHTLGPRMVRRKPVNRANLLPRPKAHLRVAAQLSTEDVSPDLLTEAEVHRRFKSVPFVVPPSSSTPTNTLSTTTPSNSPLVPRTPSSPFYHHRPTPNRFPEQVENEDPPEHYSPDSDEEYADSACSTNLVHHPKPRTSILLNQEDEIEDEAKMNEIQKWKTFRGSGSTSSEINRSGKRRHQPESEPVSTKRRAISPSATSLSSSCIGSPVLNPSYPSLATAHPLHQLHQLHQSAPSSSSSPSQNKPASFADSGQQCLDSPSIRSTAPHNLLKHSEPDQDVSMST